MSRVRHVFGQATDGRVECTCGETSPYRFGTVARAREWHRGHKVHARGAADATAWNAFHSIGTPVQYWPGSREDHGRQSKTRSAAWVTSSGEPVVMVEGYAGGPREGS